MEKRLILGLVGEIASGKGAVAKYLIKKHKASYHRFSNPIRDILNRFYLDITRVNMSKLTTHLRQLYGEDFLVPILIKDLKNDKKNIIILDGIRKPQEAKELKRLKNFRLVYITADEKIRYLRLLGRRENKGDKTKTFKQFLQDQKLETEKDIPKIGKKADYRVDNSGNIKELYRKIDQILQ
ncbi:AAA family ATPase [Patescibacteria group bacterium]